MLGWLTRFVLLRVLGARVLAVLAILGFIRRQLGSRKGATLRAGSTSAVRTPARRSSASGSTPAATSGSGSRGESRPGSGSTSGR